MAQDYPTQQIIQYIYRELPALDHLETEYAVEHDAVWRKEYRWLKAMFSILPRVQFFPKKKVVNSILEYSRTGA